MKKTEQPTTPAPVGEGRDIALDHKTAKAIATASEKAGFPIPPTAAAVLGTKPKPAAKAPPKRPAASRPKPAAKPKPTPPATPVAAPAVTGAPAADAVTKED